MANPIIIGSRGSDLALWQANHVKSLLETQGVSSEIKIIKTSGDLIQNLSFDKMEGKGFFTKEIEEALLNSEIDIAVHSHKDLETTSPVGLMVSAVLDREDPCELLIMRKESWSDLEKFELKRDAIIGTSSARRQNQIKFFRPDLHIKDLRGNVPTRIQKLRDGNYDAILLAKAGVKRLKLDLSDLTVFELDPREFIPAPAQGVLGLQTREGISEINQILEKINHQEVQEITEIERGILRSCEGGCQLPLGVYCNKEGNDYHLWVSFASRVDTTPKRAYFVETSIKELNRKAMAFVHETTEKKKS
ncbi:MAG: hydroxymethylbilane synthase [Flavobacteriales bacterium]|nr:hydroxymethylbilane synthase [Flavobacteriales bacterium]